MFCSFRSCSVEAAVDGVGGGAAVGVAVDGQSAAQRPAHSSAAGARGAHAAHDALREGRRRRPDGPRGGRGAHQREQSKSGILSNGPSPLTPLINSILSKQYRLPHIQ